MRRTAAGDPSMSKQKWGKKLVKEVAVEKLPWKSMTGL
jgi:hypothetical protein